MKKLTINITLELEPETDNTTNVDADTLAHVVANWLDTALNRECGILVNNDEYTITGYDLDATKAAAQMLGRKGGQVKSDAKAEAVKANGKLGGRPSNAKKKEH